MEKLSYRHEIKFLSHERELRLMQGKIRSVCRPDKNAGDSGTYTIRSLYFDTYDDRCYLENEMGVDERKKYRIRIYNGNTNLIKLECKHSYHGMKAKEVCRITEQQCECLMRGLPLIMITEEQKLLRRFMTESRLEVLVPKVIVEYDRDAYVYAAGNVRVTFDRNIRSSVQVKKFMDNVHTHRNILPEQVHVMEVKYDEVLPTTILELLAGGQRLSRKSFSKYALCREYSIG